MLIQSVLLAGVVVLALPSLALGIRGLGSHRGISVDDRTSFVLLVVLRVLILLLVLALSGVVLLSAVGAMIRHLVLPGLVYTFFVLDLLLATLIVLTFGRRDRRPARRSVNPATR